MPTSQTLDPNGGQRVPAWIGQALPSSLYPYLFSPFIYSGHLLPLAAASNATITTAIQSDSHFVVTEIVADVRDAATGLTLQAAPPLTVQFQNQGSGMFLSNEALGWVEAVGNFANTAGAAINFVPLLLTANSSIAALIANLDPANGYNIRLGYRGFKIFGVFRDLQAVQPLSG